MALCTKCDEQECLWMTHKSNVVAATELKRMQGDFADNVLRKFAYQESVRIIYGVMGKGNRVQLPQCVIEGVRKEYPSDNDMYMGYKSE